MQRTNLKIVPKNEPKKGVVAKFGKLIVYLPSPKIIENKKKL